jgi:phage shock protein E
MKYTTASSFSGLTGESGLLNQSGTKYIHFLLYIFIFILFSAPPAMPEEHPVWWKQVADEAQRDGYSLVTIDELKKLYDSKLQFLIMDTRTGYEFNDAHLPGAVNIEFDPGDKLQLKPEKKASFLNLLGPDKNRKIIIYCRDFR